MLGLPIIWLNLFAFGCCYVYQGVDLGDFANDPPFDNTLLLPETPDVIQVEFHLYTSASPNDPMTIGLSEIGSVEQKKTIFIIHGYLSRCNLDWVIRMKNELLIRGDFNVFCLDWENGAGGIYEQAVANARVTGAIAAVFMEQLSTVVGVDLSDIYLIGHSLGAHVAGYTGERVNTIGRITGLDPAGPNFQGTAAVVRLDKTDAAFVDVIHTDGLQSIFNPAGLGILQRSGHADFYVNRGVDQPGCRSRIFQILEDLATGAIQPEDVLVALSCDHARSREYFIESINPSGCKFTGTAFRWCYIFPTQSCSSFMGFDADLNQANAIYLVNTNAESPFCKP